MLARVFSPIRAIVGRIAIALTKLYGYVAQFGRPRVRPQPVKIAMVSHTLPPSFSGQAIVIHRLLCELGPESYCLISNRAEGIEGFSNEYLSALPGPRYQIPQETKFWRAFVVGMHHVNMLVAVLQRARFIAGVLRRENGNVVVAWTGDVLDLPAGYIASRLVGASYFAYIQDHYSKREFIDPVAREWATRLEPWLIKNATGIIVANETLRDDLRNQYEVEANVIHNSCDVSAYERFTPPRQPATNGDIKIVYTGDIYEAHYDAFHNLLAALELIGRDDIRLHLYTARSAEFLEEAGIKGPIILHSHHGPDEIPGIQQQADVLFLPLAFNSPYPDVIRTSSTAKVGEYMAARRPVLVHAPADSFIVRYFRENECGVVVDEKDPAQLAAAIERILTDAGLRENVCQRAWEQANSDFSLTQAQARFAQVVGLHVGLSG